MECLEQLDTLIEQKYGALKNRMVFKNENMLLKKDLEKAKKIAKATGNVAVGPVVKASITTEVGTAGRARKAALVSAAGGTGTAALVGAATLVRTADGTGTATLAGFAGGVGTARAGTVIGVGALCLVAVGIFTASASKK